MRELQISNYKRLLNSYRRSTHNYIGMLLQYLWHMHYRKMYQFDILTIRIQCLDSVFLIFSFIFYDSLIVHEKQQAFIHDPANRGTANFSGNPKRSTIKKSFNSALLIKRTSEEKNKSNQSINCVPAIWFVRCLRNHDIYLLILLAPSSSKEGSLN